MRKLFSLVCVLALMLSTLSVCVSADSETGKILFEDDFSDGFTDPYSWILEGNAFFGDDMSEPGNPCLSAYSDGVVCQMEYGSHTPAPKIFYNCVVSIDVRLRDYDREGDHEAGLWWRDNFLHVPDGEIAPEDYIEGPVYQFCVNFDEDIAFLTVDGVDGHIAEAPVTGISMDDGWFNMGWRIVPGKMECYINGEKVLVYESADLLCKMGSPFLLLNTNNYISFDNMVIATADYDMYDDLEDAPVTEATEATEATEGGEIIETEIVTNDNGETEIITQIVTESVETEGNDAADTVNTTANAGPSTNTGDMTLAVVVAMLVAVGAAVITKKVNAK